MDYILGPHFNEGDLLHTNLRLQVCALRGCVKRVLRIAAGAGSSTDHAEKDTKKKKDKKEKPEKKKHQDTKKKKDKKDKKKNKKEKNKDK